MTTTKFDIWQSEREAAETVAHGIRVRRTETPSGRFALQIWNPKATKPSVNYWFKTREQRELHVSRFVQSYGEQQAVKAEAKATRNGTPAQIEAVQPGDIFVEQFGYDQTNTTFFEVTSRSGRNVTVRRIAQREVDGSQGQMSAHVLPVAGQFTGEPHTHRLQFHSDGEPYFSTASYASAQKWNGQPMYSSWYA
jgi:hypothetical protein